RGILLDDALEHFARDQEPVGMDHRDAALEFRLHLRIAGGREAQRAKLFLLLLPKGAGGEQRRDETCGPQCPSWLPIHRASSLFCRANSLYPAFPLTKPPSGWRLARSGEKKQLPPKRTAAVGRNPFIARAPGAVTPHVAAFSLTPSGPSCPASADRTAGSAAS